MKVDVIIRSVGGQNIKPYLDFFYKYARKSGEKIYVDYQKGFSEERCSETYYVRVGGGFGQIVDGYADAVIATEQLEGVKARFGASENGGMVVSTKRILPSSVISGASAYPNDCMQKCLNDCFRVFDYEDDDYLTACILALRLLGVDKEKFMNMFNGEYDDFSTILDKAFARKFVKA